MTEPRKTFSDLIDQLNKTEQGHTAVIPPYWRQGRTVFGGLTSALAYVAAKQKFPDLPPLRSMHVNFTGPVGDGAHFAPVTLRQGRNVTTVQVTVYNDDAVTGLVVLSFGAGRDSTVSILPEPKPARLSPIEAPDFIPPGIPPELFPAFLPNFDVQLIEGTRPMMGGTDPYVEVWARHKNPADHAGIAPLLCIGDVMPPAAFILMRKLAPISSMNWTLNLLTDNPVTENGWWRISSSGRQAQNGYSSQDMLIWNSAGDLVGHAMQCVVLFG